MTSMRSGMRLDLLSRSLAAAAGVGPSVPVGTLGPGSSRRWGTRRMAGSAYPGVVPCALPWPERSRWTPAGGAEPGSLRGSNGGRCFQPVTHPSDPGDDLALQMGDIEIVHDPLPAGVPFAPGAGGLSSLPAEPAIGMVGKLAMTATIVAAGASLYSVTAVLTPPVSYASVACVHVMPCL